MAEGEGMTIERQPIPRKEKNFLEKTTTRIGLASAGLLAAAGIGAGAKMGFFERGDSPAQVSIATVPATVIPTEGPQLATPMPSPTPEITQAPNVNPDAKFPPATPEVEKELGIIHGYNPERVLVPLSNDTQVEYLGYKNVPVGTPIYPPFIGFFTSTEETAGSDFSGNRILIRKPDGTGGADIRGVVTIKNTVHRDLTDRSPIAEVADGQTAGEYSVLFTITKVTPNGLVVDEQALREMAPEAYNEPAKKLNANFEPKNNQTTTVVSDVPPAPRPQ